MHRRELWLNPADDDVRARDLRRLIQNVPDDARIEWHEDGGGDIDALAAVWGEE